MRVVWISLLHVVALNRFKMESLPKHKYLEFNPDTFINVRKEFGLDKQERMVEAINILEDWVKKQNHFVKKDFDRNYLERTLISTKGLVERAKTRLDNLCTFKTLMPSFYEELDIRKYALQHIVLHAILPKLTPEDYRIYAVKMYKDDFDSSKVWEFYKHIVIMSEYIKVQDYCKGFQMIFDYRDINVVSLATRFNLVSLRQAMTLLTDGYGMRIKGIHLITPSKMADAIVMLFKQIFSAKLTGRIQVHKTVDTVYKYAPKNVLPEEFGGGEKPLKQIQEEWLDILGSEEHREYLKEMNKATTIESCRQTGKFNEQYLGMPGSFRSLSVD